MRNEKLLKETLQFILVLLVFGILLSLLQPILAQGIMQNTVASQTSFFLNLFGVDSRAINTMILMPGVKAVIIPECVGLYGIFAVIALFVATPKIDKKKKMYGLLWALPSIYVINLLRLSTSFYTAYAYGIQSYLLVHDILWKTLLLVSSFLLWAIWFRKNKEK